MNQLSTIDTLADLFQRLGQVPLDRIRMRPPPGTATVEDVLRVEDVENRLCELVEGTLVEKPMGFQESILALAIGHFLRAFVTPRNLGIVTGTDGMMRLFADLVRIPDVAFISWQSLPEGRIPDDPVPNVAPDLAVEVLSRSNTPAEMDRKREEYFSAGVRLVWIVDPPRRTVAAFSSIDDFRAYTQDETLDGGAVLPGFSLPLRELFSELDRHAAAPP